MQPHVLSFCHQEKYTQKIMELRQLCDAIFHLHITHKTECDMHEKRELLFYVLLSHLSPGSIAAAALFLMGKFLKKLL